MPDPTGPDLADLYDEVAYPSVPFQQTHPDRLAVMASLYGLQPAPVERCRILEIGGGDGANLIPMALGLPNATLLGVDLAAGAIARGQQTIQALGLTNVTLRCGDLRHLTHEAETGTIEQFDYVVAHGVYCWVPAEVREALLALLGRLLAPHGVAHLSFNAYPGGHLRQAVSEIMRYHVGGPESGTETGQPMRGQEMIGRAKGLARLLAEGMPPSDELAWLGATLRVAEHRHPGALFHDELAPVSQPFYFHEVMARAEAHGLQFLAEVDFAEMQDYAFSPEVRALLERVERERGRVAREQYLDFVKGRQFRQPLLCRADVPLTRTPSADDARRFLAASPMQPDSPSPDLRPGIVEPFHGPRESSVRLDLPLAKAAFLELGEAWPDRLSFTELATRAAARLASRSLPSTVDDEAQGLSQILFDAFRAGLVQLYAWKPTLAARPGVRPKLSPLARVQVGSDDSPAISTLLHDFVVIESPLTRQLLRLLDGTRDRAALLASLRTWSRRQRGAVAAGGISVRAMEEEITMEGLEAKLWELARFGLLVA